MTKRDYLSCLGFSLGIVCLAASLEVFPQEASPRVEWERTFGGRDFDLAQSIEQTSDGGYVVAGAAGWAPRPRALFQDAWLIKLDAEGELDPRWTENPRTFGGEEHDAARSVEQTSDGGYIVAGWTRSFGAGERDAWLIKLDAEGELDPRWTPNPRTFGGRESDWVRSVQQTTDGGYIVAGFTSSFGAGHNDFYVIKLAPEGPLPARFLRGDCNDDGKVDISDAVSTLGSLFLGDGDPGCDDACDSNDDGAVHISDAIATLGVLFLGQGTIPLPGMNECGVDPTDDKVGCDIFERCPQPARAGRD